MTAITINQYRQIDVKFPLLNDLANRLRAAGARIIVRKLGKLHRIILVEEPTIASVEQILSYVGTEQNYVGVAAAQTSNTTEAIPLSNELSVTKTSTTAQHQDLPELASLDELNALSQKKLNQLAATNKIVGRSKMQPEKLVVKLHGLVTKEQLR